MDNTDISKLEKEFMDTKDLNRLNDLVKEMSVEESIYTMENYIDISSSEENSEPITLNIRMMKEEDDLGPPYKGETSRTHDFRDTLRESKTSNIVNSNYLELGCENLDERKLKIDR